MLNEELLGALVKYRRNKGRNPDMLKLNPTYFKNLLEELNYPEWIIQKKETEMKKSILGVPVELTDAVKKFEM
ncbi:hypothetical protein [Bacillus sp. SRB_331]|jgi:hypothetical protein|uniref:hypothetical protein n=1 Tax=Bacillus sp. SRB_331 TaxID=1969379 RepID=UPI000DC32B04|nr:hypothetical protein [Bacillus sp. SRB_331]RAN74612.1 hypothetical protein B5P42_27515 [Bacillus sp. SRB_331]